jgi:hypothetical protein
MHKLTNTRLLNGSADLNQRVPGVKTAGSLPDLVRLWVLLSALLVGAGWALSLCHELNRIGYGMVLGIAAMGGMVLARTRTWSGIMSLIARQFWRRRHYPLPLLFYVLAALSLTGGLLYVTTDGDGMAYRVPRVLHRLWREQWHWIPTQDPRMNIAGTGFEWLCAPLILFFHTDRYIFLINWLSYLMLPGLIFSVFIRLGVSRRVAWWWMWLLPSGWCYIMQAGSGHNDSFAVIYALASVDLALRAREKENPGDLWRSLLAAALATGVKQTDLPLALLWMIAAWPSRRMFLQRPLTGALVTILALLVSALPMAIMDFNHTGTWTGIPAAERTEIHSPFWGIAGNLFCIPLQNLMPPFFPWADRWNEVMRHFQTSSFGAHFSSFEAFGRLQHSVSEETAGIGLGICILLLAAPLARCLGGRTERVSARPPATGLARSLRLAPWFLLLIYMAKVGTFENARQLAPYYVFLFPVLLLMPAYVILDRRLWWQRLCLLVMLATAFLLITSRNRPLFPFQTVTARLLTKYPQSGLLEKLNNSFHLRSSFAQFRNLFQKTIPANESLIGYLTTAGGAEPGLSLPLGRLKVERMLPGETPAQLRRKGIRFIVVDDAGLKTQNATIQDWLLKCNGQLADQMTLFASPYDPPIHNYLVRLQP